MRCVCAFTERPAGFSRCAPAERLFWGHADVVPARRCVKCRPPSHQRFNSANCAREPMPSLAKALCT
jgi:hypothetical protein